MDDNSYLKTLVIPIFCQDININADFPYSLNRLYEKHTY